MPVTVDEQLSVPESCEHLLDGAKPFNSDLPKRSPNKILFFYFFFFLSKKTTKGFLVRHKINHDLKQNQVVLSFLFTRLKTQT